MPTVRDREIPRALCPRSIPVRQQDPRGQVVERLQRNLCRGVHVEAQESAHEIHGICDIRRLRCAVIDDFCRPVRWILEQIFQYGAHMVSCTQIERPKVSAVGNVAQTLVERDVVLQWSRDRDCLSAENVEAPLQNREQVLTFPRLLAAAQPGRQ